MLTTASTVKNLSYWVAPWIIKNPQQPKFSQIEKIICFHFGITPEMLGLKNQSRNITLPRQVYQTITYLSGYSTTVTGARHGKDHATVINSKRRILELLQTKYPAHDYLTTCRVIKEFATYFPQVDLSYLPGGWENFEINLRGA